MKPKMQMPSNSGDLEENPNQKRKSKRPKLMEKKAVAQKELAGKRFSLITVLDEPIISNGRICSVKCLCNCGVIFESRLEKGKPRNKSCGCNQFKPRPIHGHCSNKKETKLYNAWTSMKKRCYGSKPQHKNYRKRSITVCDRWLNGENGELPFVLFSKDVGDPPSIHHSIDRINNDGNYEPGNVRWATVKQQASNRSNTKMLSLNGLKLPLVEWCEKLGWAHSVIWSRLSLGWSDEKILTTPHRKRTIK